MTAIASLSRYFGTSSAIRADDAGATSEGLSTTVLPAAIARDGGPQRQHEREVPRADDQHRAVRLVLDPAAAGQLRHLEQAVACAASTCGRSWPRPWPPRRCGRCRRATPRTACGRDPARARPRWRPRSRLIIALERLAAAAYATRRCGCGRRRTSSAAGPRSLGCPGATGAGTAGAAWGIESVVMVEVLPDPRSKVMLLTCAGAIAPHVRSDPNQPVGPSRRPRPTASRLWRMWRMRRPRRRPVRRSVRVGASRPARSPRSRASRARSASRRRRRGRGRCTSVR